MLAPAASHADAPKGEPAAAGKPAAGETSSSAAPQTTSDYAAEGLDFSLRVDCCTLST